MQPPASKSWKIQACCSIQARSPAKGLNTKPGPGEAAPAVGGGRVRKRERERASWLAGWLAGWMDGWMDS